MRAWNFENDRYKIIKGALLHLAVETISLLKQVFMSFSVFFNASLAPTEDSYKYESRAAFTLYR